MINECRTIDWTYRVIVIDILYYIYHIHINTYVHLFYFIMIKCDSLVERVLFYFFSEVAVIRFCQFTI